MRASSVAGWLVPMALALAVPASAHQPVMDMAPRWEDGYGVQVRHEYRFSDRVLSGEKSAGNPFDREKEVHTTWLEGIYTFKREVRATIKIPWVDQRRDTVVAGGTGTIRQEGEGLGDIIAAIPLRKYWNFPGSTMNVGLTPQLRLPTGKTSDDFPVGDGSTDFGLSASVSAENYQFYGLLDLFWWKNTPGRKGIDAGDELGLDLNLGLHPYHDNEHNLGSFVMLDFEARHQARGEDDLGLATGGSRLTLGPILVGYWQGVMLRGEVKIPVYEKVFGTQMGRGVLYNVGIGMTF